MKIKTKSKPKMRESAIKDENTRGNWVFALFLFFWTGSTSILYPWIPMIFRDIGMNNGASGGILAVIIVTSTLSVKVSQYLIGHTKKGHIRRLVLIVMLIFSLVFLIIPITILPNTNDGLFCNVKSAAPSINNTKPGDGKTNDLTTSGTIQGNKSDKSNTIIPGIKTSSLPELSSNNAELNHTEAIIKSESSIVSTALPLTTLLTIVNKETTRGVTKALTTTSTSQEEVSTSTTTETSSPTTANVENDVENNDQLISSKKAEGHQSTTASESIGTTTSKIEIPDSSKGSSFQNDKGGVDDLPSLYDKSNIHPPNFHEDHYEDYQPSIHKSSSFNAFDYINLPSWPNNDKNSLNHRKHHKYEQIKEYNNKQNHRSKYNRHHLNDWLQDFNGENIRIKNGKIVDIPYYENRIYRSKRDEEDTKFNDELEFETKPEYKEHKGPNSRFIEDLYKSEAKIQGTICILIIFGIMIGGGIEACIVKLWHCIHHGYQHIESLEDDILDRTISSTFHLSTYGSHKNWSTVTSACWIVAASLSIGLSCVFGITIQWTYTVLGGFLVLCSILALLCLLILPIPSGSLEPPQTKQPLSLYLDDEVLREGIRRLSFHLWVFSVSFIYSLPHLYKMWLLDDMENKSIFATQACAVAIQLIGEGLTLPSEKWFLNKLDIIGLMIVSAVLVALQSGICWISTNGWMIAFSFVFLGFSEALLWMAVKHNALLLATIRDQETEAKLSWIAHKIGTALGAGIWGVVLNSQNIIGHTHALFICSAALAGLVASVVGSAALITKTNRRTRRRIYHTLDLYNGVDDSDESAGEDDWLVKRAKKEGIDI